MIPAVIVQFVRALLLCCIALAPGRAGVAYVATPAPTPAITTATTIDFPRGMRFAAEMPVPPGVTIDHAELLFRIGEDPTLNLAVVSGEGIVDTRNGVSVETFVDMQTAFVPAGVELRIHWELSSAGQTVLATAPESVMWQDPRFEWQTIRTEQVVLHSYALSDAFAHRMLEVAQETITDLEQRFRLERLDPITIWVYASGEDFSGTRQANTREAVAGLSYPGAAMTTVVIPDGNTRELGRVLPHEVSHLALYQATRNPFAPPPLWFDEGLATHVQTGGTDHYLDMVIRAEAEDRLFNIMSLSTSFPYLPAQATLAYASSWSMIAYLQEAYGDAGIARLIDAFAEGQPTDAAIFVALGVSPEELNDAWKAWIREQDAQAALAA